MQFQVVNYKTAMLNCPDWRPVIGYEGIYEVHWRGAVRNAKTKLLLRPGLAGNGYYTVSLFKNKSPRTHTVHALTASHFILNYEDKRCVNHKDGIKTNCHLTNLEWATPGENNSHAIRTGLKKPIHPARGIIQLDMQGNEISRYHSSEHAPKQFHSGDICKVANGKRKQHGGYMWRFIR